MASDSDKELPAIDAVDGIDIEELECTSQIALPGDPLLRVIGQDEAVELAMIAANQKRHLFLVGPPGTGKSMIAQALSLHLPRPTEEVYVVHNPENPERPMVEVKRAEEVKKLREKRSRAEGKVLSAMEVPGTIAEKLGFRCRECKTYSPPEIRVCPRCGKNKIERERGHESKAITFGNIKMAFGPGRSPERRRVITTRKRNGKEESVIYEREGDRIRELDQDALEKRKELKRESPKKTLLPLDRNPFVLATGASETEFLGDVRHDPYGGHRGLGTPPYERVVAGSVHEAHEGVLFVDELPHMGNLQRYILTAMQEKAFPITGRNPQSAGASVRVDEVPCDFILVGACNIQDLGSILSPLRSRIIGEGYEVLVDTYMKVDDHTTSLMIQFIAQEIEMDGRIPNADRGAVREILESAKSRAKMFDGVDGAYTLRLRELGGLIRTAGDLAVVTGDDMITGEHIKKSVKRARTIEEQIDEKYGSYYKALGRDITSSQKSGNSPYNYWNKHMHDDKKGYD